MTVQPTMHMGCRTMLCQPSVTHGCPRHGAGFPFKGDTSMNILKYIMNVIDLIPIL